MDAPYWLDGQAADVPHRPIRGRVDAVVVGGGVTGCAAARQLAEGGVRVRLHEARRIASGASGRNGGFALRGGAMPFDVACRQLGSERARSLWALSEEYVDRLEALAGDAFVRTGSLRLAADELERQELRAEHEALLAGGFAVEWVDDLEAPLAGRFFGALLHPGDGALHPARWVHRLASLAAEAGVDVREHSPVATLDGLAADVVVLATDGYTRGLLPALDAVVRPTRGQVVATAPLSRRLFDRPHYARRGYDYWQQAPDGRLIVGGWRDTELQREYTAEEAITPAVQDKIDAFLTAVLGEAPEVTHRWAGIFGSTPDSLPLAGPVPERSGVWVACGYSGHGNVLGLACGELVADAILGRERGELELFEPRRLLA